MGLGRLGQPILMRPMMRPEPGMAYGLGGNWLRLALGLLALALALALGWQQPVATRWIDEGLRDALLRAQASAAPLPLVAVVDIDEAALQQLGPWPWPRARLADLVEALLLEQQAAAVALDLVLPLPADAAGDARLATLAQHAPLVLAQVLEQQPQRAQALQVGQLQGGLDAPARAQVPGLAQWRGQALPASGFMANHAGLAGARCVGNIGYVPEADGVLRHLPLYTEYAGRWHPTLALALLHCAGVQPQHLPTSNAQGLWRLPYARQQQAFVVLSAADVLQQRLPDGLLQGRLVLVGSSALALGDLVNTPLAPLTAGVMVHAEALAALLQVAQVPRPPSEHGLLALLLWCGASVALLLWMLARRPVWQGVALLCALALLWLLLSAWAVQRVQQWTVSGPLWAYAWLLLVALPLEWWRSQRQSRRLLSTLGHYVAQPVLDEIVRQNLHHSLAPKRHLVTVLVADMADYTRQTSALGLEEAAALTKRFLDLLTRPVLAHGGTLDRYSGDGLVAFWGAPLPCPQQADVALDAALAILQALQAFNAERDAQGLAAVQLRMGVESGQALVGDLGTRFRSTYTAVGDCINFAARLESEARHFGVPLLLGPQTHKLLQRHACVPLGRLRLRNTEAEIEVFTLAQLERGRTSTISRSIYAKRDLT